MEKLQDIEDMIKKGNILEARMRLKNVHLPLDDKSRPSFYKWAELNRRVGSPETGLSILSPMVRPSVKSHLKATAREKEEYAINLIQLGIIKEAEDLLSEVSDHESNKKFLFMAMARFSHWDYGNAIPLMKTHLESPLLSPYERLIGEVNLVAAQVIQEEKVPRLEALIQQTYEQRLWLLHANLLEIRSQHLIAQNDLTSALDSLKEAQALIGQHKLIDSIVIKKWLAVIASRRGSAKPLLQVISEAKKMGFYETIRDGEFHLGTHELKENKTQKTLEKVYFGTPFASYREKVLKINGFSLPDIYTRNLSASPRKIFDPQQSPDLKPGQTLHRILYCLMSDAYRPKTIHTLHAEVFLTAIMRRNLQWMWFTKTLKGFASGCLKINLF